MSSPFLALAEELRPYLSQLVKDAVKAALAEKAEQPRYPERVAVQTAAKITGYKVNSIYQMHSRKQIPGALKVGGKLMFDTAVLQKWVSSGARPGGTR